MGRVGLSNFLQARFNISMYMTFGWGLARIYIFILGRIYYLIRRGEKQIIERSITDVVTLINRDNERDEIIKKVISGILFHYYEKLFIAYEEKKRATQFLTRNISAGNISTIKNGLNKGKGVVLITGHYGAIEYIPTLLAVNNVNISMIAKFKTAQLREKIFKQADKYGIRMIDADTRGNVLNKAINELRENRVLVTQCDEFDEWRPSENIKTTFLGHVTGLDRTINILIKRAGAEVVFGLLHRYSLSHYSLILYSYEQMVGILPSMQLKTSGEMVLKMLEQFIFRYPEQWYQWKKYPELIGSRIVLRHRAETELSHPVMLPLLETQV
ncbi:MAG: hypothetical protein JW927_18565 [Deltaproteobacteria bacterium]|nr:hypothetical protein [Deltaproteobacteria bacterium]